MRGCGAAGSAPPWHGGGQGFESPQLHATKAGFPRGAGLRRCPGSTLSRVEAVWTRRCPGESLWGWSVWASHCSGHLGEPTFVKDRSLTADSIRVDAHDPVDPDLTRAATVVPSARPDIHPSVTCPRFLFGVVVMVLAGQRQGQQPGSVVPDHQHRAVLALTVVLLERHPGPDDLAGVGHVAVPRVGRIGDLGDPQEVTRVCRAPRLSWRRCACSQRSVRPRWGVRSGTAAADGSTDDSCES